MVLKESMKVSLDEMALMKKETYGD